MIANEPPVGSSIKPMHDYANASDGDLLRRTASGDEKAFTALYRRHQSAVYRFALQMSGSTEIAEEVTQEVFMVLIRGGTNYDPARGALAAFLYGVARNHVLRFVGRERWYCGGVEDAENEPAAVDDPGDRLDRDQQLEALRKAVLALPPHYREAVVLCELHELDYADAAAVLGCPVGTIRSRLSRARALLSWKLRAGERCPA